MKCEDSLVTNVLHFARLVLKLLTTVRKSLQLVTGLPVAPERVVAISQLKDPKIKPILIYKNH